MALDFKKKPSVNGDPIATLSDIHPPGIDGNRGPAGTSGTSSGIDVTAFPYLAAGNGSTNDTTAINAAIAAATAAGVPVYFPPGKIFKVTVSSIKFTCSVLGSGATIWCDATAGGYCVQVGDGSTNLFRQRVELPNVYQIGTARASGSVGVKLNGVVDCWVDIPYVEKCEKGVSADPSASNPVTYSDFHVGYLYDNKINLYITDGSAGSYSNQCNWYGGRMVGVYGTNQSGARHILLEKIGGNGPNTHTFIGMSLEGDHFENGKTVEIKSGFYNLFLNCRYEASSPGFVFDSLSQANQVIGGYGAYGMAWSDASSGGQNDLFAQGRHLYATQGLSVTNTYVYSSLDLYLGGAGAIFNGSTGNNAALYVPTTGPEVYRNVNDSQPVLKIDKGNASATGGHIQLQEGGVTKVWMFTGTGSPESVVTASPGSVFLRQDGGVSTTFYVKTSGTGNTGWTAAGAGIDGTPGIDGKNPPPTTVSRGATILNPTAGQTVMCWRAPFACFVTNVKAHIKGGTNITFNAQRNQASTHLSSAATDSTPDVWVDGGAVQNTAYAAGDDLEIMVVTVSGAVTEAAIQVDFRIA